MIKYVCLSHVRYYFQLNLNVVEPAGGIGNLFSGLIDEIFFCCEAITPLLQSALSGREFSFLLDESLFEV